MRVMAANGRFYTVRLMARPGTFFSSKVAFEGAHGESPPQRCLRFSAGM
ncbi:MAG: hypothetical protein M3370_03965 [Actinomycetota bacterium]|nr:hypothetical protein [Actinomycetota bacterium]